MEDDAPSTLPSRIAPGDVVAGKYKVIEVLAEGGMGQVLLALHEGLDQKVAIKALLPKLAKNEDAVTRFTREAKALAKLQSEHIARVFDVGTPEGSVPYMVMEYLDGSDLSEIVKTRGPMPIHEAAELGLQACAGLAEVHAAGIIHRDLKPSNVYVITRGDSTPCLKLIDFGISKFEGAAITGTAMIMGSPGYMSPEQMRSSKDVDERTDVWALGSILYELLTGRHAFVAENAPMLCIKIATEEPDPLRPLRADIPEELEKIVLLCLSKDREKRYANVAELAKVLAPFAPPRAQGYVEKIEAILRGAKVPARAGRAGGAADTSDRATVRATPDSRGALETGKTEHAPEVPSAATQAAMSSSSDRVSPPKQRSRALAFLLVVLTLGAIAAIFVGPRFRAMARALPHSPEWMPLPSASEPVPEPSLGQTADTASAAVTAFAIPATSASPSAAPSGSASAAAPGAPDDADDDDDDASVSMDAGPRAPVVRRKPRPRPLPPRRPKHH